MLSHIPFRATGRNTRHCLVLLAVAFGTFFAVVRVGSAATAAPGYTLTLYEPVTDPIGLAFGSDGALYVGRDNTGSGGLNGDAVFITRVVPGGGAHGPYGLSAITDPDAVFFDTLGTYSGVAGSVLVGGVTALGTTGQITVIRPDQTVSVLWGPSGTFVNPSDFEVDTSGRLLMTDAAGGDLYFSVGGSPAPLFSPGPNFRDVEVQPGTGKLYLRNGATVAINVYSPSGVFESTFISGLPGVGMAFGPGGVWGNSLYVTASTRLLRVNSPTSIDTLAFGFTSLGDAQFGPGGALYVSDFGGDAVYRLEPAVTAVAAQTIGGDLGMRLIGAQPSRGEARFGLTLSVPGHVAVRVLDVSGRAVARLHQGALPAGVHEVSWDGRDANGARVSPGMYFAVAEGAGRTAAVRVIRLD